MIFLRKLINLILYSSLWIAVCATVQVQLTYDLLDIDQGLDIYSLFVFTSTIGLYGLHRLIGIQKVRAFENEGRFAVIKKFKSHIIFYSILGAIGACISFFYLPVATWLYLLLPVAISAFYIIPSSKAGKRLRDIPLIKIFLIAASWALLTTTVPLLHNGFTDSVSLILTFAERFLFVFAITIPFDIRDMEVDSNTGLRTLPHVLGVKGSKIVALLMLILSGGIATVLIFQGVYSRDVIWAYVVFLVVAAGLIWGSRVDRSDYYFSGLLDGVMVVLWVVVWVATHH